MGSKATIEQSQVRKREFARTCLLWEMTFEPDRFAQTRTVKDTDIREWVDRRLVDDKMTNHTFADAKKQFKTQFGPVISPYQTPWRSCYLVKVQCMPHAVQAWWSNAQTKKQIGNATNCSDVLLETLAEMIHHENEETGELWSEHLIIRDAFVIHGSTEYSFQYLFLTDDNFDSLGAFIRGVWIPTPPVADVQSGIVGYDRRYGVSSGRSAPDALGTKDEVRKLEDELAKSEQTVQDLTKQLGGLQQRKRA